MAFQKSEHDTKYDRQMRLWGAHGQKKLETAHICVLDAGPTSSETLKNLVLPNVGEFTIVDDAKVTMADTGNNFFVDEESIGKSRAEVVKEMLLEMNPDVKGNHLVANPAELIDKDINFFAKFRMVIASNLPEPAALKLADFLWKKHIPLMLLRSYGFIGTLRLQLGEHTIIESHPDNDRFDLMLHPEHLKHFPALEQFCDSFKVLAKDPAKATEDEKMEHRHVPYAAVLVYEMKRWIKTKGKVPTTWDETKEFKMFVRNGSWAYGDEENYQEAVEFAHRAYKKFQLDPLTQQVLDDAQAQNTTKDTPQFWIMARALREFIAKEGGGCLPVSTNVPDMHADSKSYVTLKDLYKHKADADVKAVTTHVHDILKAAGRDQKEISDVDIDMFVRNARNLRFVRTRSLAQEYDAKQMNASEISEAIEEHNQNQPRDEERGDAEPNPCNLYWYFAVRASEHFAVSNKRKPGQPEAGKTEISSDECAKDTEALVKIEEKLFADAGITAKVDASTLQELVRQGGTELHTIAAFLGGVAAQEGLKVLLNQYVPINNTFIYNGIHGSALTFSL